MEVETLGGMPQKPSDPSVSYNEFKTYEGQRYTGMKIGRSHTWNYDPGVWKEKKITPDLWQISYAVTKRRKGRAPEGSGVPVGTAYHWYIVAHQNVEKLNANDYTTSLTGLKFKIAHKRAGSEKWSATPKTQKKRMIQFLQQLIDELQREPLPDEIAAEASSSAAADNDRKQPRVRSRRSVAPPSMMKRPTRRRSRARESTARTRAR